MDTEEKITDAAKGDSAIAGRLAVTSLLHRFELVLRKFAEEEKNSGKCPPSRSVRLVVRVGGRRIDEKKIVTKSFCLRVIKKIFSFISDIKFQKFRSY